VETRSGQAIDQHNQTDRTTIMKEHTFTDRRTVLKQITATAVGGSLLTGATNTVSGSTPHEVRGRREIVEIVAQHNHDADKHSFDLGTHEVAAGWTTLELDNQTEQTHFVYSSKVPHQAIEDAADEGMALLDFWTETVTKPFQWDTDESHIPDKTPEPGDDTDIYESLFPPWFSDVTFYGGPGLTSGSRSSMSSVNLDPGEYIVECYVKDDNNDFHSYLGMIDHLSVTDDRSQATEPESTIDVSLSNDGVDADDTVRPGQHTVAVEFNEQQLYSNQVGHDIHLIRFDDETDVTDVSGWMDWTDPAQLISNGTDSGTVAVTGGPRAGDLTVDTSVSDGTTPGAFLGGVTDIWTADLPRTGYVHVNLKPGNYAWVAEVPEPDSEGLLQEFTVPHGQETGE
jgi:hypothetical protein